MLFSLGWEKLYGFSKGPAPQIWSLPGCAPLDLLHRRSDGGGTWLTSSSQPSLAMRTSPTHHTGFEGMESLWRADEMLQKARGGHRWRCSLVAMVPSGLCELGKEAEAWHHESEPEALKMPGEAILKVQSQLQWRCKNTGDSRTVEWPPGTLAGVG